MASKLGSLPSVFRKIVVKKLTTNFAEATEIITAPMPTIGVSDVLIKNKYLGVNASDINASAGRYFPDKPPPFDIGFETVGEVVDAGSEVKHIKKGDPVGFVGLGCYSEYICVPQKEVFSLPSVKANFLPLLLSGRTAAISLDKAGHMTKKDTVLVTAAAGGAGQLAVQYAKYTGCHVIGTCSSDEKVEFLKKIGCKRAINYNKENLDEVLKTEYPKGIDLVWETIGGDTFKTLLKHLAVRGRLVIVGYITGYQTEGKPKAANLGYLPQQLLLNSGSVNGFFVSHYANDFQYYHARLVGLYERKKLRPLIDQGLKTEGGKFEGLESVTRAVNHLHSGKSSGKVTVELE